MTSVLTCDIIHTPDNYIHFVSDRQPKQGSIVWWNWEEDKFTESHFVDGSIVMDWYYNSDKDLKLRVIEASTKAEDFYKKYSVDKIVVAPIGSKIREEMAQYPTVDKVDITFICGENGRDNGGFESYNTWHKNDWYPYTLYRSDDGTYVSAELNQSELLNTRLALIVNNVLRISKQPLLNHHRIKEILSTQEFKKWMKENKITF